VLLDASASRMSVVFKMVCRTWTRGRGCLSDHRAYGRALFVLARHPRARAALTFRLVLSLLHLKSAVHRRGMSDATTALQQAWMAAADLGDLETMRPLLIDHPELLDARVRHKVRPPAAETLQCTLV
jgi:hypothetical protein